MFIVVLGTVLGLIHLYVWKRLIQDTTGGRVRWVLSGLFLALLLLLVATLVLPRVSGWREPSWLAWPGYVWLGIVVYLFLALLIAEPIRIALRRWTRRTPPHPADQRGKQVMDRRMFLARASAVAAGAAAVGVVGAGMASALGPPEVLRLPVRLRRLDPAFNGFKIAVVSDIHLGPLAGRAHTERIVRMINETEPDLIAIVGDLVDGTVEELGGSAEPLRDLVSRDGAFFVTGNHEYFVPDTSSWLRELDRLGVAPLRNENTVIRRGAAAFDLAGVNDVAGGQRSGRRSRRPSRRSTAVRAHSRWPDVAVPLHRACRATLARRAVNGRRHTAVRHPGGRLLGSARPGRCATGHQRALPCRRTVIIR
jgi:uncharacterized protein